MISTSENRSGDLFTGRVVEPVIVQGRTLVPAGASVEGRVARVREPRRIRGVPTIDLRPESIVLPSGERYALNAAVVDTSDPRQLDVDDEGRIKGHGRDGTDWRDLGVGAGGGAAVGALITHTPQGAAIGAGIGAGAAMVRWLTRRHSAEIPQGTELFLELNRPMTMNRTVGY